MLEAVVYMKTENGRKYLVQLCKHFAHKIAVTYCETHGESQFARGAAVLDADGSGLRMAVSAADEEGLVQTQAIIESHLGRFAFRENPGALDWQRQNKAA